ncbi:MAG: hypothetical protein M1827_006221 [Pycnora praestabilis]|nr:MAG: hypothetical protein M1827_006221 [Pycnora praestabilis]
MPSSRILICGAGVAGSTLAYWLARHDFQVVIVERSPAEQTAGQGIDIEGPAVKIVKLMGILDEINKKTTHEAGAAVVDEQSRSCAIFEAGGVGLTKSIEIMRGDLTEILYKAADKSANVAFQFETTIRSLRQTQDKVIVELEKKSNKTIKAEEFDFVVGADGIRSCTRQLVMGSPEKLNCLKSLGASVAFFSIPKEDQDWPYSRFCQFTDRRSICIRPQGKESKTSSVYLGRFHDDDSSLRQAKDAGDRQMQKEAIARLFTGLGWETPRVIEQMMKAENFYFEQLVQVKLHMWSQNRVVLVGDAAYGPSPLTGQGTLLAILGAYVLAQELSRHRDDESAALKKYERRLRTYVTNAQSIPLGGYVPYILNPQTSWGIWLFRTIASFVSWLDLLKILPDLKPAEFDLEIEEIKA